jgi:hypothetical protein
MSLNGPKRHFAAPNNRVIGVTTDIDLNESVVNDPKETWSKPSHPRPCRAVKSSFGPLGTTPLGLTMRKLP